MIFDIDYRSEFTHDLRGLSPRKFWVAVPSEIVERGERPTTWHADILGRRFVEGVPVVGVSEGDGLILSPALARALKNPEIVRAFFWRVHRDELQPQKATPEEAARFGSGYWCRVPFPADAVRLYGTRMFAALAVGEVCPAGIVVLSPLLYNRLVEGPHLLADEKLVVRAVEKITPGIILEA